ncbi:MAG: hypothetical protein QOH72_3251 [Solirubrobacteraceae bacterium]|jgi:hypothetical protein|nr:hypothetical protein [Solirubrobacteraceae bacterium]
MRAMNPQRSTTNTTRFARFLSAVMAVGAVAALAGPVAGASALTPPALPAGLPAAFPIPPLPLAANALGGEQFGANSGCVGTNRPSVGGNNGSTANQNCGVALAFTGPAIGQISSIIGPTVIGSPGTNVILSAGPVTAPVQVP